MGDGHVLLPDVDGLLEQLGGSLQTKKILPRLFRHLLTSRSSSVTPEEGDERRVVEEEYWVSPVKCSPDMFTRWY